MSSSSGADEEQENEFPGVASTSALSMEIHPVTQGNVQAFKRFHQAVFPDTQLPFNFFRDIVRSGILSRCAFHRGKMIGVITSRVDRFGETDERGLHILTLGTLPCYRRRGVATQLLKAEMADATARLEVRIAFLHVRESNDVAQAFYERLGFRKEAVVANYYNRPSPENSVMMVHRGACLNRHEKSEGKETERRQDEVPKKCDSDGDLLAPTLLSFLTSSTRRVEQHDLEGRKRRK